MITISEEIVLSIKKFRKPQIYFLNKKENESWIKIIFLQHKEQQNFKQIKETKYQSCNRQNFFVTSQDPFRWLPFPLSLF